MRTFPNDRTDLCQQSQLVSYSLNFIPQATSVQILRWQTGRTLIGGQRLRGPAPSLGHVTGNGSAHNGSLAHKRKLGCALRFLTSCYECVSIGASNTRQVYIKEKRSHRFIIIKGLNVQLNKRSLVCRKTLATFGDII